MSAASRPVSTWTLLREGSDQVRAVVEGRDDGYAVRDDRGRELGRFATVAQALASIGEEPRPADA